MPHYASDVAPVMVGQRADGTLPIAPTISLASDKPPTLTGGNTDAQLYDQGITYNEPGLTYNEIGYAYGGVYGAQEKRPTMSSYASDAFPQFIRAYDQGTTTVTVQLTRGQPIGAGFLLFVTYPETIDVSQIPE